MARIEQIKALLANKPEDAFLLFAMAKEYEGMGDLDAAKINYLKIIEFTPDYVGVYYHLGKLYELIDDENNALQTYEQGINIAQAQGDLHAKSELAGAKLNLEMA